VYVMSLVARNPAAGEIMLWGTRVGRYRAHSYEGIETRPLYFLLVPFTSHRQTARRASLNDTLLPDSTRRLLKHAPS